MGLRSATMAAAGEGEEKPAKADAKKGRRRPSKRRSRRRSDTDMSRRGGLPLPPVLCSGRQEGISHGCKHLRRDFYTPRKCNAQVIVLRWGEDGRLWMLVQRRSLTRTIGAGLYSSIGGKREDFDLNSRSTAMREVFEETGLLDLGRLEGTPPPLQEIAEESGAHAPVQFHIFARSRYVDWWFILLDGMGKYMPAAHAIHCEGMKDSMHELEGGILAIPFGHAWVPVDSMLRVPSWRLSSGLDERIREAAATVTRRFKP